MEEEDFEKIKMKVLCVCAKGVNRSKYLASYLRRKGYSTKFGGVEGYKKGEEAPKPATQKDVDWADIIVIVRKRIVQKVKKKFKTRGKKVIVIDVTDSRRLLPKEFSYLKKASEKEFDKKWRRPQLRKAIKPYLPLKRK